MPCYACYNMSPCHVINNRLAACYTICADTCSQLSTNSYGNMLVTGCHKVLCRYNSCTCDVHGTGTCW